MSLNLNSPELDNNSKRVLAWLPNGDIGYRELSSIQILNNSYEYPEWWNGIKIPLSIRNGEASYNYDVSDNISLSSYTPYFISPTGNNSNDGLTESTPKQTIVGARTAGADMIYMMPGNYPRDSFWGSGLSLSGRDLIIIGIGEVNITNGQTGLSWTLTTNNTYKATRSTVSNVVDFKFKNKYGFYDSLKQVTSQSLCEAESGTYFTDNITVWVHTKDNRMPDSDIFPLVSLINSISANTGKVYHENLNIYGEEFAISGSVNSSTLQIFCKNVNIPLCKKPTSVATTEYNCFKLEGFKTAILQDCSGFESTQDVFNYHNVAGVTNPNVLELNCKSFGAGLNSVQLNNQASSAHEGINILRVNGNYYGGNTQTIADVGGSKSILVGCELNTGTIQPNTVIFYGGDSDLFGCKLYGNKKIVEVDGTIGIGVNISNSILDYSTTEGDVTIN